MNMNFFRVIEEFFTGKNGFQGRMTRSEFWWWLLWFWLFSLIIGFFDISNPIGNDDIGWISRIFLAVCFFPYVSNGIKRMHDIGRTGWWILVPIVNWIMFLLPSDGPNQYDLE